MRIASAFQNTPEWLESRHGKVTASRIADVLDILKRGGEGASRRNYRVELVAERLTGLSEDHFVSPEMLWGTEMEPIARSTYEMDNAVMVESVGFVLHPTLDFTGGSPDGLVGDDGLIEIKAPKTTTHIKWMLNGRVPEEHQAQILWNLCCTGRAWADFISFDPRLPDGLKLFTVRMQRDNDRIAEIEAAVTQFNAEVDEVVAWLRKRVKERPAPPVDTRSEFDQLMAMIDAREMTP